MATRWIVWTFILLLVVFIALLQCVRYAPAAHTESVFKELRDSQDP
jgi:hypothetical protein